MKIFYKIISLILLFAIINGLLHLMIPHCSDFSSVCLDETSYSSFEYGHHSHINDKNKIGKNTNDKNNKIVNEVITENSEIELFKHDDHYEKDLLNFIICVISGVKHSDKDFLSQQYTYYNKFTKPNAKDLNKFNHLILIFLTFNLDIESYDYLSIGNNLSKINKSLLSDQNSKRGPPLIS